MRAEKIDHIHIYVNNVEEASKLFSALLGRKFCDPIYTDEIKIKSVLEPMGIELIEPTSKDGFVGKAIKSRGEGLYGISFKVSNLDEAIKEFQSKGIRLVGRIKKGKIKEAQFHPKDTHGVMIELCEYEEIQGAAAAACMEE